MRLSLGVGPRSGGEAVAGEALPDGSAAKLEAKAVEVARLEQTVKDLEAKVRRGSKGQARSQRREHQL